MSEELKSEIDHIFTQAEVSRFNNTSYITVDELKASVLSCMEKLDRKYKAACDMSDMWKSKYDELKSGEKSVLESPEIKGLIEAAKELLRDGSLENEAKLIKALAAVEEKMKGEEK